MAERKHDAEFLKQISPIQYITPSYPPVLISGGNKDFLTDTQSLPFVKALKEQQVPVTEIIEKSLKPGSFMNISFLWAKRKVSKPLSKPWIFYISFHLEEKIVKNKSFKIDHVRLSHSNH